METREEYKVSSFDKLLEQINQTASDVQRDRGTLFEKLVVAYLKNEPTYKNLYKNVWELKDVPKEYGIPSQDRGVDIVAEQYNGDIIAIQAKFYKDKIGKSEINSFVAETGARYYNGGLIVSTVDDWNRNARSTIEQNHKNIEIIGISDLRNSQIDWSKFNYERPENISTIEPKNLRFYQKTALEKSIKHFESNDRGQLIMAPGTGKTFTSLKIAEALSSKSNQQFKVLYLVPSIQLLTQTLRGWNNDTVLNISSMAVTSDRDASRGNDGTEDIKAIDIGYPATTSKEQLLKNWEDVKSTQADRDMLVVFSTYQSIEVIGNAQGEEFPEFDLIIADEAHRTTGAHEISKDASVFTKVHDNKNVKGKLRLYQTATPKIYGENAKKNAKDKSILISSMDDESKYGDVIYRMGFGQAVSHGILTDYKVMVLAVDETAIQKDMQRTLADPENGLNIDDVGRIVGIWNGMMRRNGYKNPIKNSPYDGPPLERAIAFTRTIEDSKKVTKQFEEVVNEYIGVSTNQQHTKLSMKHADGSMNALKKGEVLDWLADPNKPTDEARIVSNVRFLTEGIDVPTLDAVIFLAPKKSQVDIVQAVGRIMRKSEGKDYGYIILPVVIPAGETPETVLDNNKHYEVVWQIINALRSVDERFEAMVDKLNIAKPKQLKVIGVGGSPSKENDIENNVDKTALNKISEQTQLEFEWDKFETAIYGKIVQKVGDRKYLENWSADVAKIAQRQISWIKTKLEDKNDPISMEFKKFISSLHHNINESIDENQAAEMLSQHLITKPIFEALFSDYSFVNNNPVSTAMENIVKELEKSGFVKEQESLAPLYESVKMRAEGVEKSEDKQKIIISLYDNFFKTAFNSTTKRMGIVFTPVEVVDFIVKSVDDLLKQHFDKSIASEGVHILDPFTGTGTFVARTLDYLKQQLKDNEISLDDITRKYVKELHANEIILLSYYIAAINIEATFDEINGEAHGYRPFEGIVLTDTFKSTEPVNYSDDANYLDLNDNRLEMQKRAPITVVIGNPPYSAKQSSTNDNNNKLVYEELFNDIKNTYVKNSSAILKNAVYDSYIQAFKWASNRIKDIGIISFVSNGSFIDSKSLDGFRKSIYEEFNYIYIYNLRGDQRTQGEVSRKEGGKIFGSGSRTPIAITVLIKDGSENHELYYKDIGDYLTTEKKLEIIKDYNSVLNIDWENIIPDKNSDWINQKDELYETFIPLNEKNEKKAVFDSRLVGVATSRDPWVYGFSKDDVAKNINRMIDNYNSEIKRLSVKNHDTEFVNRNDDFVKWTRGLLNNFKKGNMLEYKETNFVLSMYRPFVKKWLYYDKNVVEMPSQYHKLIINEESWILAVPGNGNKNDFSTLLINQIPEKHLITNGQFFFKEYLMPDKSSSININQNFINHFKNENDAFYYIYALLHSKEYNEKYKHELIKGSPRLPLLRDANKYIEIGKKLVELHSNYETQKSLTELNIVFLKDNPNYKVEKMKYHSIFKKNAIIFNNDIEIHNIPLRAYDYKVSGRSAIDWIIDQYKVREHDTLDIIDDPNDFSEDPKYIFNLLLSIITLSIKTLDLIDEIPELDENS